MTALVEETDDRNGNRSSSVETASLDVPVPAGDTLAWIDPA